MINKQIVLLFSGVSLITLVVSCAGTRPASLDRARSSLTQAQQDPAVVRYAPAQLSEAQQMMTQAENVWNDEGDGEEASHLAYLTEQKAGNAVAVAREKAAEDETQRFCGVVYRRALPEQSCEVSHRGLRVVPDDDVGAVAIASIEPFAGQRSIPAGGG